MRDLSPQEVQQVSGGVQRFDNWWDWVRPLPVAVSPDIFVNEHAVTPEPNVSADLPTRTPISEVVSTPTTTTPLEATRRQLFDKEFGQSFSIIEGRLALISPR